MELYDAIMNRRSMRKFEERDVPEEILQKCLDAGRWAPSWANTQCGRFVVVKNAETKKKIAECLPERNPALRATAEAPVVVVFVAKLAASGYKEGQPCDDKQWHMYDVGLVSQNFCLAAHAEGLGTVIVGLMDYNAVGEVLGLPEGYQVVAFTPLGYPTGGDRPPKRKELSEITHYEKWEEGKE